MREVTITTSLRDPHPGILFWSVCGILLGIYFDILPGILSDILSDVLFYRAFFLAFYLTYILTFYLEFYLTYFLIFYLASILAFYLTSLLTFCVASTCSWGRQCPTEIWSSRLRSGSAHWALDLAVESGSAQIWSSRLRGGARGWEGRRNEVTLIKPRGLHLAGGGKRRRPGGAWRTPRGADFVRACAVEMHTDISQEPFHARIYRKNARDQDRDAQFARACAVETHGQVTRAILCENLQEKCREPRSGQSLCELAQLKRTWTSHKSHLRREFTRKMPGARRNTLIKHRP